MKKKPLRIALVALAAAAALAAAVLATALLGLDAIVRRGVEKGGTYALKVPVTLSSASVSLRRGTARLNGLEVGNPEGFKSPRAMVFGEISATLNASSLNKDVIEIPEVVIRGAEINIEGDLKQGSNLARLTRNLDETIGSPGGKAGEPKEAGKRLRIGLLRIENAKVSVGATFLGGEAASIDLDRIELRDIGDKGTGATAAEVTREVLRAIMVAAGRQTGRAGRFVGDLTKQLQLDKATGELQKAGQGLIEGLKGIFK
jgi:uncharacterized protein involved in outer membrane biogenesis